MGYVEEIVAGKSGEFKEGFIAGATAFAWWKDGEQVVGTTNTTLKSVIDKVVAVAKKEGLIG